MGEPVVSGFVVHTDNKETDMAIGVVATLPVQEGKNEEFEAVFLELAAQVTANEAWLHVLHA